jgi:hypothetical protein
VLQVGDGHLRVMGAVGCDGSPWIDAGLSTGIEEPEVPAI